MVQLPDAARRPSGLWGRKTLAFWLAAVVALASFGDRGLVYAAGASPAVQGTTTQVDALAEARDPVTAPRPAQATALGVLSRLLTGESKLASPPGKTPLLAAGEIEVALTLETAASSIPPPVRIAPRSPLDAAHPPTGPPA